MGTFYTSSVKAPPTVDQMEADVTAIVSDLWPDTKYRVERCQGLPVTPQDNRAAKWDIWLNGFDIDCAFCVVLLNDGRMEFKVPRSQWDENYTDQQKVRRRLVRRYNA